MSKNKKAFLLVLIVLILSLSICLLIPKEEGRLAQISIDGQVIMSVDLSDEDKIIDLSPFGRNISLEIKNKEIRFISSDCPNKLCVNTGFISKKGETAVCLPNKTAVTVLGK